MPLAAQQVPILPVPTEGLAGQQVAVMPLTLVATDPVFQSDTLFDRYRDRRATLSWADSLIGDAFVGRGPEVKWVLPPALRKIARRAPGIVDDPDQMGQALLRSAKMKDVPDPLRASLRNLMAVVGGRVAMVPAALGFTREADGRVRAELSLVAADTRAGKIAVAEHHRRGRPDARRRARPPRWPPCSPWPHDLRRDPDPRRRDRPRDHGADGQGARGDGPPLHLGRGARRDGRRRRHRDAASRRHGREHPEEWARPQGTAHHADRHRLPLGQRGSPEGVRALRQRPARPHPDAGWPVRERGHRAGAREPRRALHRRRALRPDRRRPAGGGGVDGHRDPGGLRAHRALRLRVRAEARPEEGHDRPQGEHPQDGERTLSRGGPGDRSRNTKAGSRRTT